MDFGNILEKWENGATVYDKDAADQEQPLNAADERRRLRSKKPEAWLDIHGHTRSEAQQALESFFNHSKRQGLEKIAVIHGKGNHSAGEAVLKRVVMDFIEHCPFTGESGRGKAAAGGEGATWVVLK